VMIEERYEFWVPGEPVAKSSQMPPISAQASLIVQIDPRYGALRRSLDYCALVKGAVCSAEIPVFNDCDPVQLSLDIYRYKYGLTRVDGIVESIKDGIQQAEIVAKQEQITAYGYIRQSFMGGEGDCGVKGILELDPRVIEFDWLLGWFRGSKRKTLEYQRDLGMDIDVERTLKDMRKPASYWWTQGDDE
jgi:hypothetical protein